MRRSDLGNLHPGGGPEENEARNRAAPRLFTHHSFRSTATPATPSDSWAYFTVLRVPGDGFTPHPPPLETPSPNGASLCMYMQERPGGPGNQVLTMRRFLIAIASLAVLPAIASAQGRGMASGMARPAMAAPAPHLAMRAAQPVGTHIASASHAAVVGRRVVRTHSGAMLIARSAPHSAVPVQRAGSGRPLRSQDIVPGLGFDFAHVAAVHPHGINGRGRNARFAVAYFPFYGGGYYMPLSSDDVEEAPAVEAQAVDNGGPDYPEPAQAASRSRDMVPSQNYEPAAQTAAEQEAEQYVFVRRDGTVFFATAYAWENGTLRYITREGLRHTVTADKLDLDATQQFNEQRGLNFRLPA